MSSDVDWDNVSVVILSKHHREVVESLAADGPATPSQLVERTGNEMSEMSRALNDLRDKDLVELLVPEERKKGRIYGLTDAGEEVANHLNGGVDG